MYLATDDRGIFEVPKECPLRSLFCQHGELVNGVVCSKNGMRRISGEDRYLVCAKCGKVLGAWSIDYD